MIQVNLKWLNNWKANLLPIAGVAVLLAILFLYPKIEMQKRAPEATPGPSSAYKLNENLGPLSGKSNEARQQITAKVTREVGDELVYSAEGVQVLYLIRNDIFKVGITKGPFEEKKQQVEEWFQSFGLTQADLCRFGIEFMAGQDVKPTLTEVDMAPTDCKVAI